MIDVFPVEIRNCISKGAVASGAPERIERAVLRSGTWEFVNRLDVPYRVVINESVELAKTFGAEDGHKYINGVLDKLAKHLRAIETQRGAR